MSKGELVQKILNIDNDCVEVHGKDGLMTFTVTKEWWESDCDEYSPVEELNKILDWCEVNLNGGELHKTLKTMYAVITDWLGD